MKEIEMDLFSKTYAQLESLHNEISLLSKKSPTDGVNKFKLRLINNVLETANKLLWQKKPFEDFTKFQEDELPNNSDATLILSQYLSCLEELRYSHIEQYGGRWYWKIDGKRSETRTFAPKNLKD